VDFLPVKTFLPVKNHFTSLFHRLWT